VTGLSTSLFRIPSPGGSRAPLAQEAATGASTASRAVHCIAVDPRAVTGVSACWFSTAEEADRAFLKMSNSSAVEGATLERFRLLVPASATREKVDELVMTAIRWDAYLPIVRREGDRRAANDSALAPLGSYELGWPFDADPDVGIRPPRG
jgi:hypothetical protein